MSRSPSAGRLRGALWGLAVGDALGATQEFLTPDPTPPFVPLLDGPQRDIEGGGWLGLAAGAVTDDTQLASALASSLRERADFDQAAVARNYVAWFRSMPPDVGTTTALSLSMIEQGMEAEAAALRAWEMRGRDMAANGALMRVAPIGAYFANEEARVIDFAMQDARITHYDPRCQLASAALCAAIAFAVRTDDPDPYRVVEAAQYAVGNAEAGVVCDDRDTVGLAVAELLDDLEFAARADPGLYDEGTPHMHDGSGFVRTAFRLAFWELLHAPTLEAGLIDVVNRGGDADTNGAIAGALLGAVHGDDAVPTRWRQVVGEAHGGCPIPIPDFAIDKRGKLG